MSKKQNNTAKTETGECAEGQASNGRRFLRYCFVLLLAGVVVLLWLSMLTYSPTDYPAPTVSATHRPVENAVGYVGAFVTYELRYWLGSGVYMALLFATVAAWVMILGGRITDVPWRIVGLVVVVIATSAAAYLINPQASSDLYRGSAGVLGTNAGQFLQSRFKEVGAWVVLLIGLGIGVMFSADQLVLQLPHLGKKLLRKTTELPSRLAVAKPAAKPEVKAIKPIPVAKAAAPAAVVKPAAAAPVAPVAGSTPAAEKPAPPKPLLASLAKKPVPAKPVAQPVKVRKVSEKYELPKLELLAPPETGYIESQQEAAEQRKRILQQTLDDFGVSATVLGHMTGPVITVYEMSLAPGVKVAAVGNLATDIARTLAVPGVRIIPPRFGKDTVGIEVPNLDKETVRIKELMNLVPDAAEKMHLPLYLGKDAAGDAIVVDLASMPHMLIAGTTGSGKSVCINTIIMSLLLNLTPEDVRLILVDPKMVEMAAFENIPHLLCPIVTDMRRAEEILEWATVKMDERYELLKEAGVKNIAGYNRLEEEELYERMHVESDEEKARVPKRIPHFVIIIDELADLMMTSGKEVEGFIIRIAQKARAVGIHLVLATQRPSVNVVTGLIKSNMPCRISFRVASRQESRIVLDQNGAEILLGQGDMLLLQPGTSNLVRAQGTYLEDSEIRNVVKQLRKAGDPNYSVELMRLQSKPAGEVDGEQDELFDQAVEIVLASQRGSVSLLQRRMAIGYSRASRIIDQMAGAGLLGEYKGSQARECLMTLDEWQHFKASIAADQSGASALDGTPTSA